MSWAIYGARGRTVSDCAHRVTTVSPWGLCEHARRSCLSTRSRLFSPNLARRDLTGGAVLLPFSYFLSPGPVGLFGQVAGLGQTAGGQRGSSLFLFPCGRGFKGAVGGVPHRARIGRALFHRARSASTGAPTCSPAS